MPEATRPLIYNFPPSNRFQLVQFISRTPRSKEHNVNFDFDAAEVRLISCTSFDCGELAVEILCGESDQQLEFMAQVCTMCLPPLSTVKNLGVYVKDPYLELDWDDNVENNQWLEFLRPFSAVKDLYLSEDFQLGIASALQELEGGTTKVLPSLQNIFLVGFEPSGLFPRGHWTVCCRQTAFRSRCSRFVLLRV